MKRPTVFCDIDGTIFKYRKFETYRTSVAEVLPGVVESMTEWKKSGTYIVLTTARPEYLREWTEFELESAGIPYDQMIMEIGRGPRYIINDSEDPDQPRAIAIPLDRDKGFNFII